MMHTKRSIWTLQKASWNGILPLAMQWMEICWAHMLFWHCSHLPFNIEILPIQSEEDNHNCGFGIIATMAIILRDLVLDNSRSTFDDLFSSTALQPKTCATNGEVFCDMPQIDFRPLPALPKFKRGSYLP